MLDGKLGVDLWNARDRISATGWDVKSEWRERGVAAVVRGLVCDLSGNPAHKALCD
jgi:hypothetical protein